MVKEKVTLGNERVSQEMVGWNAVLLGPTHRTVFRFQLFVLRVRVSCFCGKLYNSV